MVPGNAGMANTDQARAIAHLCAWRVQNGDADTAQCMEVGQ